MTPTTTPFIHPEINSGIALDLQNLAFPDLAVCECADVCVLHDMHIHIISNIFY